jgi:hypothetical protein
MKIRDGVYIYLCQDVLKLRTVVSVLQKAEDMSTLSAFLEGGAQCGLFLQRVESAPAGWKMVNNWGHTGTVPRPGLVPTADLRNRSCKIRCASSS